MGVQFSFAIENSIQPNYFTEKLLDCFAHKVVPIYWGCPNIDEFFHPQGILQFETIEELKDLLITIDEFTYDSMIDYVEENYNRVINGKYNGGFIERIGREVQSYID